MFGINFWKVVDDSLAPNIPAQSYVLSTNFGKFLRFKANDIVVIKHKRYGLLIKRVAVVDKYNFLWCVSAPDKGIAIEQLGPISKSQVVGKVLFSMKKSRSPKLEALSVEI